MKKNYVSLNVEVILLSKQDIITSSGGESSGVGAKLPTDWLSGFEPNGGKE